MKFENKKHILSICLTILMVFGTHISGYADENSAPVFSEDESTTRSVAENTAAGKNIGTAFTATDADDNDTLTYTLSGTDAASFSIVSTSGQLQTSTALDFETKSSYSVTVSVSDGNGGSDAIDVTIGVTNVNEPPRFPTIRASLVIAENAAPGTNIGAPFTATDPDIGDTLTYSLRRGDREAFQVDPNTGQVQTKAPLDYETKRSYTDLAVRATDSSGAIDAVIVTINVTDVEENRAPSFAEVTSTTRAVAENTGSGQDIGSAVSATDPDNDTLTYTIDGVDAAFFSINRTNGQLQTKAALDYETKTSYAVTVFVFDGNGASNSIDVTINITEANENRAPVFTDGSSTTRSVAENTASRQNIGSAVSATDPDNDTLTYTLGGTDAAAFRINTNNGQLKTRAALDYETKSSYTVTITVSDSELTDTIDVTINVTDVDENRAPSFTEGNRATRSVAENTGSGVNIGSAVSASDPDNDTLTYTLGGADAAAFSINDTNGQLKTSAALDYETKTSYSVTITVSDSQLTDTIDVTINVTDVEENRAPSFAEGTSTTRAIAENTGAGQDIGSAVSASDPDDDTLTYTLGGTDAASFSIDDTNGQLQTSAALDYETKAAYTVTITVSDGELTDSIDVTINITDVNENRAPVFTDGSSTTRSIAENTASGENIGSPVAATDADTGNTLTYTLSGTDVSSFSIVNTSGQLQTNAALNYESKSSYSVTVGVSDGNGGSDSIPVTISVTDVNEAPNFATNTATRSIAENTGSGENIGAAVVATDPDTDDTLTYTLGGTDVDSFSIVNTSGQLRTNVALNHETKASYSVTVTATDGGNLSDTISVMISVTNVNEAPSFATTTATRSVAENTAADTDIGDAIAATDVDANTTLTYTLSGTDAESFRIDRTNGQLRTRAALDYETKTSYSVTITVSDSQLTDTIDVTINVTDVDENRAPSFTEGNRATRSVAENTGAGQDIGSAVSASDPDDDTLTYTLGGTDAAAFDIVSTSGQLQTKAALDYETKTSCAVTVSVSDGNGGSDSIAVTINITDVNENRAPVFTDGSATTRSVAENTGSGQDIGSAVSASDPDDNTLTYTLGGADAASFGINGTNGQLRTNTALNYESDASYSVIVSVSDGNGGSDSIDVTINVTNVNEAPAFKQSSLTRSVPENTPSGTSLGNALDVSDPDRDTLSYTLGGPDATSFSFDSTTRRLKISAALDYETKTSYIVTITVSDTKLTDTINVTINVTNVNEAPSFTDGSNATRIIAENTASGTNIGTAVAATDVDANTTLTYTLSGTDAESFRIDGTNGQLRTSAALDYEAKTSYSVTITVSDSKLTDTIDVTINVTNVNEAPNFANSTATRAIAENTDSGEDIGAAVVATDPDTDDTLTYTLGGPDVDSFSIVNTSGQLRTHVALDHETKASYSVTVTATDGDNLSDTTTVTISVTNVNETPSFTEGSSATRAIAENTAADTNIGSAVAATDPDNDTLTYTLSGADAESFSINGTNGQLKTKAALDHETKASYSVTVTATDGDNLSDTITVTISVTNVNEAPSFATNTATRSIPENTVSGENIGTAVTATDVDTDDTLTYTLSGADAASFSINGTSGQLKTKAALDHETKASYSVTVTATDGKGSNDSITVTINVTDANDAPVFTDISPLRIVVVPENTPSGTNIGAAITATDADNDTLTYSLGGTDAGSFSIVNTLGQLQAKAALDYETKSSYSFIVSVSDGNGGTDSINVTISVKNVNEAPSFTEGSTAIRYVAENTAANTDIGTAIAATDVDVNTTLTYTLGGTDAASFSINSTNGQLKTKAALDHETKPSYTVTITVSDSELTDTIDATVNVTDVDEILINPPLSDRTQQVQDAIVAAVPDVDHADDVTVAHLAAITELYLSDKSITSLKSGDFNDLTALTNLNLGVNSISDISALKGLTTLEHLYLSHNSIRDISALAGLTALAALDLGDNSISDISALADLTAVTYLYLSGNSISDISALKGLTTLRVLYLTGDSISDISALEGLTALTRLHLSGNPISDYGPLRRLLAAIAGIEDHPGLTLDNLPPMFTEGTSTTRAVAENTPSGQDIGAAVFATDMNNDTLTYSLGGTDAASFRIDGASGQLQTRGALDYETKTFYSVTVSVSDGDGSSDSIDVTISVTNVNEAPSFTDGANTTHTIAENTAAGTNIGTAVAATDPDTGDTLTYTLGGTDAAAFSIVSTNGQLRTNVVLNYETKTSYSVTVSVSDSEGSTDTIDVTIDVTDVYEPIINRTKQVQDAIIAAVPDVDHADDVTVAHLAAINHLILAHKNITSLKSGDFNDLTALISLILMNNSISDISALAGLTTLTSLDLSENSISDISALEGLTTLRWLYLKGNPISDYEPLRRLIAAIDAIEGHPGLTLDNLPPVFTDGTSTTRAVAENTPSGQDIGAAVSATDMNNDTLTYSLGGTDADAFSIVSTNGQLRTSAALDYETKNSYSVIVFVSDGNGENDSISVTINVTEDNDRQRQIVENAPVFTEGENATRAVAENTASGTDIGNPVSATDADGDTLTYWLEDETSFSIVSNTGQLQTKAALDYETKSSYSVTITASDGTLTDTISVTINVTDLDESRFPTFTEGASTTRSIAENADPGVDIGSPVTATDPDTGDTLTYSLGGTDVFDFTIVPTSGQLRLRSHLNYERKTSYSVTVFVSDGNGGSDSISVTINVTDVNEAPRFTESVRTIRTITENTASGQNIGSAVSATDPDTGDTLTYSLGGTDAASFSIVNTSGQLRTRAALDYETKSIYSVTITVSDGSLTDSISVTISVALVGGTTIDPPLSDRTQQVRDAIVRAAKVSSVDDVTGARLAAISRLSLSSKGITSLKTGDFAGLTNLQYLYMNRNSINDISALANLTSLINLELHSNSISDISPLANLTSLTNLNLMHNSISDISALENLTSLTNLGLNNNSISNISVLEHLTSLKTLLLSRNSISNISVLEHLTSLKDLALYGNSISDISVLENLTTLKGLGLSKNSISDISALEDLTAMEYLYLGSNSISDISALAGLTKLHTLYLYDNSISDISALEGLTSLRWLQLYDNSISDISVLEGLAWLVELKLADNSISDYGPLRRLKVAIELKIAIELIEGRPGLLHPGLTLDITIPAVANNNVPVFTDGDNTTRSIAENTAADTDIGTAVAATDADTADTLTYYLGGTDAKSFSIVRASGQLQTNAELDYETKSSYTVTVAVSDGKGGSDSITVTITVTDVVGAAPSIETLPALPQTTELLTNFPNPFNPETWIPYQLAEPAEVTITIYDVRGRVVRTLPLGNQPAGLYRSRSKAAHWDGRNHIGEKVATGVYFYTLKAGDYAATRKLLIRK